MKDCQPVYYTMQKNRKQIFATRLKAARKINKLSLQGLADKLKGLVSKQALHKYEQEKMLPDSSVLIALAKALDLDLDYFSRSLMVELPEVDFRKRAKLRKKEIDRIKEISRDQLERYLQIESFLGLDQGFQNPLDELVIRSTADAEETSNVLRDNWKLGYDPLPNIVEMLEENGIKIIEVDAPEEFDGLAAMVGNIPVIVLNSNLSDLVRKRFTAVHELGHLLMQISGDISQKVKEKNCDAFAGAFLLPADSLKAEIGISRTRLSVQELIYVKNYYGISIAGIIFRAKQTGIISERSFQDFWKWRNQHPDRRMEIGMGEYKGREESNRFEQLVLRAVNEDIITSSKGANLLGISMRDIRKKLILKWA